jgi:hypothetical protein
VTDLMTSRSTSATGALDWKIIKDMRPHDDGLTDEQCKELWVQGQALAATLGIHSRSERASVVVAFLRAAKKKARKERIKNGARCLILAFGDVAMDPDVRRLLGAECEIVKRTKGGLLQLASVEFPSVRCSVPERNVELLPELA